MGSLKFLLIFRIANKVAVISENVGAMNPDAEKLWSILEELRVSLEEKNRQKEDLWIKRKDLEMTTIGLDLYSKFLVEQFSYFRAKMSTLTNTSDL